MCALQVKEVGGISYEDKVKLAICHDGFFIFVDENNKIESFDESTLSSLVFQNPNKRIKGEVKCVDFSPNRKFCAAGFSDGSIQLFDIETGKASKLILKPHDAEIKHLIFCSDNYLLSVDSAGVLLLQRISVTIGIVSTKEMQITKIKEEPLKLYQPKVHSFFVEGKEKSSKLILSSFADLMALSTSSSLSIITISKDVPSMKIIKQIMVGNLQLVFHTIDSGKLLAAILYPEKIEIYEISASLSCTLKMTIELKISLVFITFLSSVILIGFDSQKQFVMISLDDATVTDIDSPIHGFPVQNETSPVFFTAGKLWSVKLQSFSYTMESFIESNSFDEAVDFCKKCISGNALATTGLSTNPYQRILLVEKTISKLMSNELTSQLTNNNSNAKEIAQSFIQLNNTLKMQDWLIEEAFPIFKEVNQLEVFIEQIINFDPHASIFTYNHEFAQVIMNITISDKSTDKYKQIKEFLMSLTNKVLPPKELLEYANRNSDDLFISDIFINKLNDIYNGLQILANADMYDNVCESIIDIFNAEKKSYTLDCPFNQNSKECLEKISKAILWVYSLVNGKFPHIEKICKCKLSADVFTLVQSHIEVLQEPISFNDLINSMIHGLCSANVPNDDPYLCMMMNLVIQKKAKLNGTTLKLLIPIIFSHDESTVRNRPNLEKLLIYILTSDVPGQFKESLLQLCDSFGYSEAKRKVQEDAKKYENAIKESFIDENKDPFDIVNQLLSSPQNKNEEAKNNIRNAILTFSSVFIAQDVDQFAQLVHEEFPDSVFAIIREVQDENSRYLFIRSFFNSMNSSSVYSKEFKMIKLPSDIFVKYITFLCRHFPRDVCPYIRAMNDEPVIDLLEVCKKYSIYDSCAVIYELTNDLNQCSANLVKFEQTELVLYANGKLSYDEAFSVVSFLWEYTRHIIKKRGSSEETIKLSKDLISGMTLPLYAMQNKIDEINKKYPAFISGSPTRSPVPRRVKNERTKPQNNPPPPTSPRSIKNQINEQVNLLAGFLKRICTLVSKIVSFPVILELLVVQFQELHFGLAKSAILSIMHDFSYDVDTNNAMFQLYRLDEINEHEKYIQGRIQGLENNNINCCTCKCRLMGVDDQIQIFPCGHSFHKNERCLPKQVCPICNPTERIDQDIVPPTQTIPQTRFRSQLRRFEFLLQKRNILSDKAEDHEVKKGQILLKPVDSISSC